MPASGAPLIVAVVVKQTAALGPITLAVVGVVEIVVFALLAAALAAIVIFGLVLTRLLLSRRLVTFDLSTITALEPESRWGGVSRRFGERLASGRIDPPSSTTPRGSPPPRQQTGLADQLHALSYALKHPEQR